jgi:hypothetical protein
VRFSDIHKYEDRTSGGALELVPKPLQLRLNRVGISGKEETLKWPRQDIAGCRSWVEPANRARADRPISAICKPRNYVFTCQANAVGTFFSFKTSRSQPENLAELRVQVLLPQGGDAGRETNEHGCM